MEDARIKQGVIRDAQPQLHPSGTGRDNDTGKMHKHQYIRHTKNISGGATNKIREDNDTTMHKTQRTYQGKQGVMTPKQVHTRDNWLTTAAKMKMR